MTQLHLASARTSVREALQVLPKVLHGSRGDPTLSLALLNQAIDLLIAARESYEHVIQDQSRVIWRCKLCGEDVDADDRLTHLHEHDQEFFGEDGFGEDGS